MTIFHPLTTSITPPDYLNDPFDYEPHPLVHLAADEVRAYLATLPDWSEELAAGKMFGVLVCRDSNGQLGFLAAYSGQIGGREDWPWFVPAVFDYLQPDGHFKQEEAQISAINHRVAELESATPSPATQQLVEQLKLERRQRSIALQTWLFDQFRMLNAHGDVRTLTDIFRFTPQRVPPSGAGECCAPKLLQYAFQHDLTPLCIAEFWQGRSPKAEIRHHNHFYTACRGRCLPILTWMLGEASPPAPLQKERGADTLTTGSQHPGQYTLNTTFQHSELYTPLSFLRGFGGEVLYEDGDILVVVKPPGLLSVPGKVRLPSLEGLLRERYPHVEGPMIVHRLDMDTSGLMVIALSTTAYHHLQQQFFARTIYKRYMALLDGTFPAYLPQRGTINLPMRPDHLDRPRQIIDFVHGKQAVTDYEVGTFTSATTQEGTTRILLTPHTGRTHQLRVHCAHRDGLGLPIKGDPLYGTPGGRLCLHADRLSFVHPVTKELMTFESPAPF